MTTLTLTPTESVTIRASTPDALAVEVSYGPMGSPQMWNAGADPGRALWRTAPRLRTEQWFAAIDRLHREGRVGTDGMPGPLAFGVLLSEYRDVFRLAVAPDVLLRPALAGLGLVGRLRGYEAKPGGAA